MPTPRANSTNAVDRQTNETLREQAYEYWAYVFNGNVTRVGERLGIPPTTIRSWVTAEGWTERRSEELNVLLPHLTLETERALAFATLHAAQRLEALTYVAKQGDGLTRDQSAEARALVDLVREHWRTPTQPTPTPALINVDDVIAALSSETPV